MLPPSSGAYACVALRISQRAVASVGSCSIQGAYQVVGSKASCASLPACVVGAATSANCVSSLSAGTSARSSDTGTQPSRLTRLWAESPEIVERGAEGGAVATMGLDPTTGVA